MQGNAPSCAANIARKGYARGLPVSPTHAGTKARSDSRTHVEGRRGRKIRGPYCRLPSVFTAHTWCFAEGTSWKWKLAGVPCERLAARFGSAIINVSDANRRLAASHGISDRVRLLTIHNGITDVSARAEPEFAGIPRIVMVARCAPQKDQALLLRALAEIDMPVQAIFVGDGETRPALEAEVYRLNLRNRVGFLGERRDVAQILSACHIFALPTRWEGFPLSILEAMRAGLPVVASNVGGVAEAVIDSKTGFLAPCGDEFAFRARLRELIENPPSAAKWARPGGEGTKPNSRWRACCVRRSRFTRKYSMGGREPTRSPSQLRTTLKSLLIYEVRAQISDLESHQDES